MCIITQDDMNHNRRTARFTIRFDGADGLQFDSRPVTAASHVVFGEQEAPNRNTRLNAWKTMIIYMIKFQQMFALGRGGWGRSRRRSVLKAHTHADKRRGWLSCWMQ